MKRKNNKENDFIMLDFIMKNILKKSNTIKISQKFTCFFIICGESNKLNKVIYEFTKINGE